MYFETRSLTVGYSGKPLIQDINIAVERGSILTLVGPNGSGKSTILKTITRHLQEIGGVVTIDRASLFHMSNRELATKLSVMLTERIDPEMMTCGQVVAMGRYPYTNYFGSMTPEDRKIVRESLALVRAEDLEERPFTDISDGQRQRIMLARAICQQPSMIVLDEPTSYLDIRHKIELLDILRKMASEKHVAVIMSLHEIDLAAKVSDRIICVKGDKIEISGTPEEVFTDGLVQKLYGLESGSFNTLFGSVELSRPEGKPEVFVLAGGGLGIPWYRMLQKHKLPFATGVLWENDMDTQVASALSENVVLSPAFMPVAREKTEEAERLIAGTEYFADTGVATGEYNAFNERLRAFARSSGKKMLTGIAEIPGLLEEGK